MKFKTQAFTLVELIVVVTILAILATIWFVSYSSYLTWVRDTNRIAQLTSISDGLNLYSTKNDLPIPDDNVEVSVSWSLIAYQGIAWANTLETIDFSKWGKDPKDGIYYSYYLTKDRKYFQLLAFLEESESITSWIISSTHAVDYTDRIPTVAGKKLGILTDNTNTPLEQLGSDLDLVTVVDNYKAFITSDEVVVWTGGALISSYALRDQSLISYDFSLIWRYDFNDCTADDSSLKWNNGILNQSPQCVSAKIWKWYKFNGLNQYVMIPYDSDLEYTGWDFSYWFWVNVSSADPNWWYIVSKPWNGSWQYNYQLTTSLSRTVYGATALTYPYPTWLKKDTWQHIFTTYDSKSKALKTYINATLVEENSFWTITSWIAPGWNINARLALMTLYPYWDATERSTHAVEGLLDEVYIYKRTLSQYEIGVLYRK
jgi:prepilin-type N-terminal cleavage/methylation domain-containing protein